MIYIMLDKGLRRVKDAALNAGQEHHSALCQLSNKLSLLMDTQVQIELRLSAWEDFEFYYDKAREIEKGYPGDTGTGLNDIRNIFIRKHMELCYQNIEQMRENGELERLGINLGEKQ